MHKRECLLLSESNLMKHLLAVSAALAALLLCGCHYYDDPYHHGGYYQRAPAVYPAPHYDHYDDDHY